MTPCWPASRAFFSPAGWVLEGETRKVLATIVLGGTVNMPRLDVRAGNGNQLNNGGYS